MSASTTMNIATILIWGLRILLPLMLFWIYFKIQQAQGHKPSFFPSSRGPTYKRGELLNQRTLLITKGGEACQRPAALSNLLVVTPNSHPELFERNRVGGDRKRDKDARSKEQRKEERRKRRGLPMDEQVSEQLVKENVANEEKKNLESLLNYVAFSRKPPTPITVPANNIALESTNDTDGIAGEDTLLASQEEPTSVRSSVIAAGSAKSDNADVGSSALQKDEQAQMVLRGALKFGRVEVANQLYEQLVSTNVDIDAATYTLFVNIAVKGEDLKCASDYLMKMEAAGFAPPAPLLDKVMELYSKHKSAMEKEEQKAATELGANMSASEPADSVKKIRDTTTVKSEATKIESDKEKGSKSMSADAPTFVPMAAQQLPAPAMLHQPPPPPPPPPVGPSPGSFHPFDFRAMHHAAAAMKGGMKGGFEFPPHFQPPAFLGKGKGKGNPFMDPSAFDPFMMAPPPQPQQNKSTSSASMGWWDETTNTWREGPKPEGYPAFPNTSRTKSSGKGKGKGKSKSKGDKGKGDAKNKGKSETPKPAAPEKKVEAKEEESEATPEPQKVEDVAKATVEKLVRKVSSELEQASETAAKTEATAAKSSEQEVGA